MIFNKVVKQSKKCYFLLYLMFALVINNTIAEVGPNWIEQFGIRWTFDKDISTDGSDDTYQYGTFVNGDYWIIGPVTIVSVSPETTTLDGNLINGSMVNPSTEKQGYDERGSSYQEGLAVEFPLTLKGGNSLISTESWTVSGDFPTKDVCEIYQDLSFAVLKSAAVLTVLPEAVPDDAFRPSYFGTDKTIYRESDLDYTQLPSILPPEYLANSNYDFDDIGLRPSRGNTDTYPTVADRFARIIERPWIMHLSGYVNRYLHPTDNQPNYYRETYRVMQRIALLLCCDLDTIYTDGTRRKLVIPTVQLGIDSFYTFNAVAAERAKQNFPVLLTGLLMDNKDFLNIEGTMISQPKPYYEVYYRSDAKSTIASDVVASNQFYNGTTVGWRGVAGDSEEYEHLYPGADYDPDTGTHPAGGDVGEWDEIDYVADGYTCPADKLEAYRRIISPQMVGLALASDILNLRDAWNHPAFFDYIARWTETEGRGSGVEFVDTMWDTYNWLDTTSYTLTINAENGTVAMTPEAETYREGETVTLTATANDTYTFSSWSGDTESTENPITIVMDSNKTITATFAADDSSDKDTPSSDTTAASPTPVAEWRFNEDLPSSVLDSSGNDLDGTLNATVERSADMGSVIFNGTDSYITCGNDDKLNLSSSMSISVWIKIDNPDWNKYIRIVSKKAPWNIASGYQLEYNPATNYLYMLGSGSNFALATGVDLNTDWHHIAAVVEDDQATIYVDGKNCTTDSTIDPIVANDLDLEIGRESETLGYFEGQIDDLFLYNQTLTEEEVVDIYTKGRNDGLTSHYLFDDMENDVAADTSGCGLDGTLISDPAWGRAWAGEEYLSFSGTDQAVEISTDGLQIEAGAITMLVEPASTDDSQFLFGHVLDAANRICLYTTGGQLNVGLGDSVTTATDIASLSAGQLYHLALTWDNGSYAVYVDGQAVSTGTYSELEQFAETADIANMGTESYRAEALGFDGIVDDVRLYQRSLSDDEIQLLMWTYDVRENKELAFTVYNEDQDGNAYVYTAGDLPTGAAFDTGTQQFVWSPWYDQSGEYQVLFTSQDGSDQQIVTLSARDAELSGWYEEFLTRQGVLE